MFEFIKDIKDMASSFWGGSPESSSSEMRPVSSGQNKKMELPAGADDWKTVHENLYGGPMGAPQGTDIDQGDEGDCWLMATMAAMAFQGIEGQLALQNLISQKEDGTFDVKLYNPDFATNGTVNGVLPGSATESVSPSFPVNEFGGWTGADPNPNDRSAMWPAIIEKAMAQHSKDGNYEGLYSNDPGIAMAMLQGAKPDVWRNWAPGEMSEADMAAMIASHQGQPIVGGTAGVTGQILPGGENGMHAYAVLGTEEKDGEIFVKVYNPFGISDGDDSHPDGVAPKSPFSSVKMSDFVRDFESMRIGQRMGRDMGPVLDDRQLSE